MFKIVKTVRLLPLCFWSFIATSPTLLIKIPTRERSQQFFTNLDRYYALLSQKYPYHFLITCDEDDKNMNCGEVRKKFENYQNLTVIYGKSISKIDAYNRDLDKIDNYDLILATSDDAIPVVYGYDQIIIEAMQKKFPDFDGVIKFNDGHQKTLNTLPVIGIKFYKRFNYIYYPTYKSIYPDLELTLVSKLLKKELVIDQVLIRHDHPIWKTAFYDNLYRKNDKFNAADRQIFVKRAKNNFYLPNLEPQEENFLRNFLKGKY